MYIPKPPISNTRAVKINLLKLICINNTGVEDSLELGKTYICNPGITNKNGIIKDTDYYIINDVDLYTKDRFVSLSEYRDMQLKSIVL